MRERSSRARRLWHQRDRGSPKKLYRGAVVEASRFLVGNAGGRSTNRASAPQRHIGRVEPAPRPFLFELLLVIQRAPLQWTTGLSFEIATKTFGQRPHPLRRDRILFPGSASRLQTNCHCFYGKNVTPARYSTPLSCRRHLPYPSSVIGIGSQVWGGSWDPSCN